MVDQKIAKANDLVIRNAKSEKKSSQMKCEYDLPEWALDRQCNRCFNASTYRIDTDSCYDNGEELCEDCLQEYLCDELRGLTYEEQCKLFKLSLKKL